jgi:hypothetical protein
MYCMVLKVYTSEEAARGPNTFFKTYFANFCNKMNLPQPDSGPDSNVNSPYYTVVCVLVALNKKSIISQIYFKVIIKSMISAYKLYSFYCHPNKLSTFNFLV